MKTPAKIALCVVVATSGLTACDLDKLSNQATATAVVVATVLSTPPIELRPEAVAGVDGGVLADAGVAFDAGATVPPQQLVTVFFGHRGSTLEIAPTGAEGATVTLSQVSGGSWPLVDQGGGSYALVDGGFTYTSNATYDFTVVHNNMTYVAEVEQVPQREIIPAFHPPAGYLELAAGQDFSFTRPEPAANATLPMGFVTVFPLSSQGAQGQPTYTNVPTTPLQFLKLVAAPSDWQKQLVEIPGSAFPSANQNYVIILQSAKTGGAKSDNLFVGSAILAGTAEVAIVKTH